jgi:hypothetical protein
MMFFSSSYGGSIVNRVRVYIYVYPGQGKKGWEGLKDQYGLILSIDRVDGNE